MKAGFVLVLIGLIGAGCAGRIVSPASTSIKPSDGIKIIASDEVLSHHVETLANGDLIFWRSGCKWRLITDINDSTIANHGDGSFHPLEPVMVKSAIDSITEKFRSRVKVDIYLLPYPRAGTLGSSSDSGVVYLSPGVYRYSPAQSAGLVAHELGHTVHELLLPDTNRTGWREYAQLRGIADSTVYRADARHADRPHEIFAEDFRVLFGGAIAAGGGSIENHTLKPPSNIIEQFFFRLLDARK
jgi:hypothetical protein